MVKPLRKFLNMFRAFPWNNKEIKTEAEARSLEMRQEQAKTRALEHNFKMVKEREKQAQIMEEIDYYKHKDDEPEPEQNQLAQLIPLIMMLKNAQQPEDFIPLLTGNQNQPFAGGIKPVGKSFNTPPPRDVYEKVSLTDEQIKAELAVIPRKYLKIAKGASDDFIKSFAQKHFAFNEPTVERAIEIIRGEF